jgi:hydroxymethylpyrimidine/phosphomethylpyrimidine kinase
MRRLLTIAGSDSGGGAGIQADLKTFQALGAYGMSAITAVTVQNTLGVTGVYPLPPEAVVAQIRAVVEDIGVDAVKIGMLHSAPLIAAVSDALAPLAAAGIPVVVDPVMRAKGGHPLLEPTAEALLAERLLPLATVVTPNLPEAERLTGLPLDDEESARAAGRRIRQFGAGWALVKGGHRQTPEITDWLVGPDGEVAFRHPRIETPHTHGTGCTLSSAIAVGLAEGRSLPDAVERAEAFVYEAIRHAPNLGHGHGPLNHWWAGQVLGKGGSL